MPTSRLPGAVLSLLIAASPAFAQEAGNGEMIFNNACRTCHTLREGDNRLGPHLSGIVGRKAGAVEGYSYSSALKESGLTFDEATLERFVAAPDQVVNGHNMKPYTGMPSAEERKSLIAFLKSRS